MGERKVRSDKKRDVKATVSEELKDAVYRLAYLTQTPIKDVCEKMILYAMTDREIIDELSQKFRRDIRIGVTLHLGNVDNVAVDKRLPHNSGRITTRLHQYDYDAMSTLSYALDVRPARTAAILIEAATKDYRFINNYVKQYLHRNLDSEQMRKLKLILRHVNDNSEGNYSWAALISAIANEVTTPILRIKEAVTEFVVHNWRDK